MKNLSLGFVLFLISITAVNADDKIIEVTEMLNWPMHSNSKSFSYDSSPDGICKVLGYQYGISGSIISANSNHSAVAVRVGDDGKILDAGYNYIVKEVTCVNKIPHPGSAIKNSTKNEKKAKISSEEVVKRLPMACVYVGLWKEINANQIPDISPEVKNYVNALIPILRGTFKNLDNMDCPKEVTKEEITEAAMKLSKEIASKESSVNQNTRNSKKESPKNKSKTLSNQGERGVRF